MMKFNKSEIMKNAWRSFKANETKTFAQALKNSWAAAKGFDYEKELSKYFPAYQEYAYFISRKQAGVIFANFKKGTLNITNDDIKFIYNKCVEIKGFDFSHNNEYLSLVLAAVEAVFDKNYKAAELAVKEAARIYNVRFAA